MARMAEHSLRRPKLVRHEDHASAANLQPLKYALSFEPEQNAAVFGTLAWAARQ